MASKRILTHPLFLGLLLSFCAWAPTAAKAQASHPWQRSLRKRLEKLEAKHPDQLGLYLKDLETGQSFSWRGDEKWYLASGVKVPIALEVFHRIDERRLSPDDKLRIRAEDYVDGAGSTNRHPVGSELTIRYLLEQMLIHSDNTASDLLIRAVGLDEVNASLRKWSQGEFSQVTTLGDVRRRIYGEFHPLASRLRGGDFLLLKEAQGERDKIETLSRLLGVPRRDLRVNSLETAYARYYAEQVNTASLRSYGNLLEKLAEEKLLSPRSTKALLMIMARVRTGTKRIKAGFPKDWVFAHKTGTQHARICDLGLAWRQPSSLPIVIAACSRNAPSPELAEKSLRELGTAISAEFRDRFFRSSGNAAPGPPRIRSLRGRLSAEPRS